MSEINEQYKLKTNPFRLTPSVNSEELIWAGFNEIKEKFENRIKKSIKIPNSTLALNWGEYGSGKTHAARYFSKNDVLLGIASQVDKPIPYSMLMSLPKGREPIYSLFISVIDKLDIKDLKEKFKEELGELQTFIDTIGSNFHIQNVLKAIFSDDISHIDIKNYLYGNMSKTEIKGLVELEILRSLNIDDYTKLLAGLFSCLTYKNKFYSCIILWIDEFEDIAVVNNSNIDKINNFLREILDSTPNNLLIFLNLTQSALVTVEDLGQYIYESVESRIKEKINFDLPTPSMFKDYLKDLLKLNRITDADVDDYFPFSPNVVDALIELQGDVSLRKFNESLSLLLELSDMDKKCPIDMPVFENYKSEILWNKD